MAVLYCFVYHILNLGWGHKVGYLKKQSVKHYHSQFFVASETLIHLECLYSLYWLLVFYLVQITTGANV